MRSNFGLFHFFNISAKQFGATDFVNPREIPADQTLQAFLVDKFDGGFDYTFG